MKRKQATTQFSMTQVPILLIVRNGSKWGVGRYTVDVTNQNAMCWKVAKWYSEYYLAQDAMQALRENS